MIGVINLYKPKGITSSDAVVKVKKLIGTRAVGHMGTLDPQGEGVLILGVGKATRLFDYFLGKDKVYEADFKFGVGTDTLDGEGKVIYENGAIPTKEQISEAIGGFIGPQLQIPPKYSAKKVGGKKAYDMARGGEEFELKPCEIEVYDYKLLAYSGGVATVRVHCSSGTYIRSLCRDLASSLGTYAIMTAIKRIRCGNFRIEDSVKLEELSSNKIISVFDALPELTKLDLPAENYLDLVNGRVVGGIEDGKYLVSCCGELFGIGESKDGQLRLRIYMREV